MKDSWSTIVDTFLTTVLLLAIPIIFALALIFVKNTIIGVIVKTAITIIFLLEGLLTWGVILHIVDEAEKEV